jgi:hypothetical protein
MSTKSDIQKKAMLEALTNSLGNVSAASIMVGISRNTHYTWLHEDPKYKTLTEEISDLSLDFVEGKLFELIDGAKRQVITSEGMQTVKDAPNVAAIIFFLKTKGKRRGYSERLDPESQPINIIISDKI